MGVSVTEYKCPCWNNNQRETFQKLIELKDIGLVIYHGTIPTDYATRDADSGNATDNDTEVEYTPSPKGNVFILHNTMNDKITPGNIILQFDKNDISCPKCRQKLEHAHKRMQTIPVIEERGIIGICDHCYFNASGFMSTRGSCICKRQVKTFLTTHEKPFGGLTKNMKKIIQSWLSELDHVLKKKDSKKVLQRPICRSRSEVDINLYSRKVKKSSREPKIQMMFDDGKSVSDTEHIKKGKDTRDFVEHSNLRRSHKMFNNRMIITSDDTGNVYQKGLQNMKRDDSSLIKERQHIDQSRFIDEENYKSKDMSKRLAMETYREVVTKEKHKALGQISTDEQVSKTFTKVRQKDTYKDVVPKKKSQSSEQIYDKSAKKLTKPAKRRIDDLDEFHKEIVPKKKSKRSEILEGKNVEELTQKTEKKILTMKKKVDKEVKIKNKQKELVLNKNKEKKFIKDIDITSGTEDIKKKLNQSTKLKKEKSKKKAENFEIKRETIKDEIDSDIKTKDIRKETIINESKRAANLQDMSVDIKNKMKNKDQSSRHKESLKKTDDNIKEKSKKKGDHSKSKQEINENKADGDIKIENRQKEHIFNKGKGKDYPVNVQDISVDIKDVKKKENGPIKHKGQQKKYGDTVKDTHLVSINDNDITEKSIKKTEHSKIKQVTKKNEVANNPKEPISQKEQDLYVDIKDIMKNMNQSVRNKDSQMKKTEVLLEKKTDPKSDQGVKEQKQEDAGNGKFPTSKTKDLPIAEEKQKTDIVKLIKTGEVEKKEVIPELNVAPNKLKRVNPSEDDLILRLIKIHQSTYKPGEKHEEERILNKVHDILKKRAFQNHVYGTHQGEFDDEIIYKEKVRSEKKGLKNIIIGEQVCKLPFLPIQHQRVTIKSSKGNQGILNQFEDENNDDELPANKTKDLPIAEEKQKSLKLEDKVKSLKNGESEKEEVVAELSVAPNKLKLINPSADDLILRLIKIHQSTYKPRVKHDDERILNKVHDILKKRSGQSRINTKHHVEFNDERIHEETVEPEKKEELQDIIIGEEVCQYKLPFLPIQPERVEGVKPIIFHSDHKDKLAIESTKDSQGIPNQFEDETKLFDDTPSKGIIRYALSDRTFIEKGWTALPMEKVVRKMNIYHMRPAHPEFDWFEHNKNKGPITYDTGEKLAEIDEDGHGRWYYRNGRLALDYYDAEETNAQQRFVVYSSGERDERGRLQPITVLATFDYLGNGVVFDNAGKIRLKYNQTEGIVLDRSIGPVSQWKWHSLNDPPVLQQVMIDNQLAHKDPKILKMGDQTSKKTITRPENEDMLAIEFDNFIKEKSKKLTQKFKPFQIKMKALKINEHFSLRILDQASIYLIFRDGSTNLKINMGMILNHQEIVDTDIAEVGEVSNSMEQFPAKTDSIAQLQQRVAFAQRYERSRTERERRLHPQQPCESADNLTAAASRPLRAPLMTKPMIRTESTSNTGYCSCSRKPSNSLYYDTR